MDTWAIVALATAFGLWHLAGDGLGNTYYTAAIVSGAHRWRSLFFSGFDPAGVMAVDKPPLGLVAPAIVVRIFGLSSWTVIGPQVAMFAASAALLRISVNRWFGRAAGLVAGVAFVLTPIEVAVAHSDNPDALMVLLTVISVVLVVESVSRQSARWAGAAGAVIGLGVDTKLLQAMLPVPAILLALAVLSGGSWRSRVARIAVFLIGAAVVGGAWIAVVDHVSPSHRPYVASSTNNTARDLAFGFNGTRRVIESNGQPQALGTPRTRTADLHKSLQGLGPFGRLVSAPNAMQSGWLLPEALIGGVVTVASLRGRRQRVVGVLLTWVVVHASVLTFIPGVFHAYYVAPLVPEVAALLGASVAFAMEAPPARARRWRAGGFVLLGGFATTLAYPWTHRRAPWVVPAAFILIGGAAVFLIVSAKHRSTTDSTRSRCSGVAIVLTMVGLLLGPARWAVAAANDGQVPADPKAELGGPPQIDPQQQLIAREGNRVVAYARAHRGSEVFEFATTRIWTAADEIVRTGRAVLELGGFTGTDPYPTLRSLQRLISTGGVRFVAIPEVPPQNSKPVPLPPAILAAPWAPYVRTQCRLVPASVYGGIDHGAYWRLYNIKPLHAPLQLFDCGGRRRTPNPLATRTGQSGRDVVPGAFGP